MLSLIKNLRKSGSGRKVARRGYRPLIEGLEERISLSVGVVQPVSVPSGAAQTSKPLPTGTSNGH